MQQGFLSAQPYFVLLRYEAGADQGLGRAIGINPELSIQRIKSIGNQLDLLVVYVASCSLYTLYNDNNNHTSEI